MQIELLEDLKLNEKAYETKILNSIKENIYQNERYKVAFTLALGATPSEVDMKAFAGLIRESDKFIVLDDHICCTVFPFTDPTQGVKAASNLLSSFEMKCFSQKIFLSIVNTDACDTPEHQVQKLFDILRFAIENGMENMPLDSTSF